ncbi:MAG: NAD(P)H-binding protein, partial [Sulfurimonas sp.]
MKVLLTGANGYIGRRLKKKLLQDASIELKIFVRNKKSLTQEVLDSCEVIEGDTLNKESL